MRKIHAVIALLAPLGIVVILITAFFWKLLTSQYTWMDHPDMAYQVLPWLQFQAASWHKGVFPLWDPNVWGGQPLVGQMQPGAAYPLNWLLFLMPLSPSGHIQIFWVNIYFVFTHWLAGLFSFALCRDLNRSKLASVLGGVAFSASGVVGSLGWPQMLNGAVWIPLVLLFFIRVWRGERPMANAALSGGFLGISFLSGHHQIPTFMLFAMGVLWGFFIAQQRRRAAPPLLSFCVLAALTSMFQVLPAYETGVHSIRWVGSQNPVFWGQSVPYIVHEKFSLPPVELLGLLIAGPRQESFVGVALIVLAAIGLVVGYRRFAEVRLLVIVLLTGVALSLGGWVVLHGIAYVGIPLIEKARTPAMALVLVQTAIAVLAAFGVDQLKHFQCPVLGIRLLVMLGALPWLLVAIVGALDPMHVIDFQPLAIAALAAVATAIVLYGLRTNLWAHRSGALIFIVLVMVELSTVIGRNYRHREFPGGFLAELDKGADIAAFLRSDPTFIRLEVDTEAVPFNIGDWEGIPQFRAYLGGMTANVARVETDRLAGGDRAIRLFALTHFLSKAPSRPGQTELFRSTSGLRVYRNPHSTKIARAWSEGCSGESTVTVAELGPHRTSLKADLSCRSLLVLSQTYFPGWQVRVDGRRARLLETHGVLQGVELEAGSHTVEFTYHPTSVFIGAALTCIGLLTVACALLRAASRLFSTPPGRILPI